MLYVLVTLALFGHWAICIYAVNRLHATALPHRMVKLVDGLWYVFLVAIPAAAAVCLLMLPWQDWLQQPSIGRSLALIYAAICWGVVPVAISSWLRQLEGKQTTPRLESNHTSRINVVQRLGRIPSGSWSTTLLARLPLNQVFELWTHDKTLRLPRLPAALDGVTITHLSDLHFTGRVTQDYFELIVDQANGLQSDLIVISGDIIDNRRCFGWLSQVLGKLSARHGVYFVLGNHDLRIRREGGLRRELVGLGFVDLGGRYEVIHVRDCPILLAGNELPWFVPAADMSSAPVELPEGRPFRVAVSHSPTSTIGLGAMTLT